MKLIHLSDLHIGKRVNEFSLLEDQRYILNQILSIVREEQADGVILAGDIYDKPVPPAEAVSLFDSFLTSLAEGGRSVFLVSGNHDSAERLAFGAQLLSSRGVYLSSVYDGSLRKIRKRDAYGEVEFCLLPFLKPATVRHALGEAGGDIETYQDAVRAALGGTEPSAEEGEEKGEEKGTGSRREAVSESEPSEEKAALRRVLVAHQFVTGAARCESEEILVGGLDNVDASLFDAFDYVALGHIHSPQHVGRETVRYCGTPLKYSFSEAEQEKSVTVAELFEKGRISIKKIPLRPLRDMRKIRGTYLEVTALDFYKDTNREDYLHITLTDEEDVPDGLAKLRVIYPNLMRLEYDNRRTRENRQIDGAVRVEQKTELELFEEFYELQNNRPMSGEQKAFCEKLMEGLRREQGHSEASSER